MIVVPFEAVHLINIELQEAQSDLSELIKKEEYGRNLQLYGGWSGIEDGMTIACGGLIPAGHKALAWMLISKHAGKYMIGIIRVLKKHLETSGFERIEMIVDHGFEEGFRMAKMLGFKCETPKGMKNYFDGGKTAYLYARI